MREEVTEMTREISNFLACDEDTVSLFLKTFEAPINLNECYSDEEKLNFLSSLCLIADYKDNQNKFFFPIDPQYSFPAIVLHEVWNADSNLHTLSDLQKREDLVELNVRYKQSKKIVKELKCLYKKQLPFLKRKAITVQGCSRIASYISELLETANNEILAVVSPPHLLGEIVWRTVVNRMSNGVKYLRITTFDEILRHGYEIAKNEVQNYDETLYIYNNEYLPEKFYVINNVTIAFFIPDIHNKDFKFEAQIINNNGLSNKYVKTFCRLKDNSINYNDLVDKIDNFRSQFLSKAQQVLSNNEIKWLADIFDYGLFITNGKHNAAVIESAKQKCLMNNWINITSKGEITAKYCLQNILDYGD